MKTFFKSILSISLSVLSQSGGTANEVVSLAQEASAQSVQVGHEAFPNEKEPPSDALYGTKSVGIAFVLANLN